MISTREESIVLKFIIFSQTHKTCIALYRYASLVLNLRWMVRRILCYLRPRYLKIFVCSTGVLFMLMMGILYLYTDD